MRKIRLKAATRSAYLEVKLKGVVYAWSDGMLRTMQIVAEKFPDEVIVECFGSPRPIAGLASPPIGRMLRKDLQGR